MDSRLCDFSVDTTCLCQTLVRPLSEVFIIKKPSYFEYILGNFFFFFFFLKTGGHIHFLTCHLRMLHYGM